MQGSGTFSVEAMLSTLVPKNGRVLLLVNGAYGKRMVKLCETAGIPYAAVEFTETEPPSREAAAAALDQHNDFTHLAAVHCETTSGIFNPLQPLGELAGERGLDFLVDAMSSFGGVPVDVDGWNITALVSSANKCIQGTPGFGFVLVRRDALAQAEGNCRSLSLDLYAQWQGLDGNGQFRFTPPTHALLAFRQALAELKEEGGVSARSERYQNNNAIVLKGLEALGFKPLLEPTHRGYIITSFHYPEHANFDFETFYQHLNERGLVIYPGKVTAASCFRIGNIGHLFARDMEDLVAAVEDVKNTMAF
jgi:2-aminoethylphosphonate--pyruvate transaminase